jgi:hypothetical protein
MAETQPQLQSVLLRLSAMISLLHAANAFLVAELLSTFTATLSLLPCGAGPDLA